MPQYELMYIIGTQISDDQIPQTVEGVKKFIEADGGIIEKSEELGKKKLAYPIQKTRNGYYVVVNFSAPPDQINQIEHRIRTMPTIIRHLVVNTDETLIRMEKDRQAQARLKLIKPRIEEKPEVTAKPAKKIEIDLDAEIEKAIESTEELK